jgi:hypothetical protein
VVVAVDNKVAMVEVVAQAVAEVATVFVAVLEYWVKDIKVA